MPTFLQRLGCTLAIVASLGALSCAGRVGPPSAVPPIGSPLDRPAASISEAQFAHVVHQLLLDGTKSDARTARLIGVVRRQFARALQQFDMGNEQRGLNAIAGAAYLVRVGELRPEMFDATAASAFDRALAIVAPAGDEARALAFMNMRLTAPPKNSPELAHIREHLEALRRWLRDTRNLTDVENAGADQRTFGERSVLEPTPDSLAQALEATNRWVNASIDFNAEFRPGIDRPKREQALEALRGIRTGAVVLAALYLRHGDAAGAIRALERSEARRITPPGLLDRLSAASTGTDPTAWAEIGALYGNIDKKPSEDYLIMAPEIMRGAAWGAMLEAYRRDPSALETSLPLAQMLGRLGMPEVGALMLAECAQSNKSVGLLRNALGLLLRTMMNEDEAHDSQSARRVFQAGAPLLEVMDTLPNHNGVEPSPAQARFAMASVEIRNGNLVEARVLLERGLKEQTSIDALSMLAGILHQTGDDRAALDAIHRALAAPDAARSPLSRAEALVLAVRIHRSAGNIDLARNDLAAALGAALEGRSRANTPTGRAAAERVLARIAYYYGDRAAVARAIRRGFELAETAKPVAGVVSIEAASCALLLDDVSAGREAVRRSIALEIGDEDLVYAALWDQLLEQSQKANPNQTIAKALASIHRGSSWISHLADWGERKIDDATLMSRARDLSQRSEAAFYIAMRKRAAGDPSAAQALERVARGPAIQLVETHIAQELNIPLASRFLGPPPTTLP